MVIRKASIEDLSGILKVNLNAIFGTCSSHYDLGVLKTWVGNRNEDSFKRSLENGQLFVWDEDGEVKGFLDVMPGEILAIYTEPTHERKGIGSELMKLGIEEAGRGREEIVLYASLNAVTFYERFDFKKGKEVKHPRNGVQLPVIEMKYKMPQPVAEVTPLADARVAPQL